MMRMHRRRFYWRKPWSTARHKRIRIPAIPAAADGWVIAPGARDLELHYTAIGFSAPEKIGFRYKLDGLDSDWKEAGSRRVAYYQHLPPDNFLFHVQACNADGVWNEQDTKLAVIVLPFFWETTLFRSLGILVATSLLAGTLLWITRRNYKLRLARLQNLNAIERERLRISKDMHDHVGSVLTQVSQLSDMGLNETGDRALVKNRLERIGSHSRVAVQALDEIVWATNPKNDNLPSVAEYVSRFCVRYPIPDPPFAGRKFPRRFQPCRCAPMCGIMFSWPYAKP